MEENVVLYETRGPIALVTMNRPKYRNAQSYHLLDDLDAAFKRAVDDAGVKVIVLRGAGGNFSSGHDLGTPEQVELRAERNLPTDGIGFYETFRHYNYDLTIGWRNIPKPTIAMVEGFCIFGGWMIACAMDLVFAGEQAQFLPALLEYYSVPWDLGFRKTKELLFEMRFLTAPEAMEAGFVNRVYPEAKLEEQTMLYATRVAENSTAALRMAKLATNKIQDVQGYTASVEGAFADYLVMMNSRGTGRAAGNERRLEGVDLALRGLKGERPGL